MQSDDGGHDDDERLAAGTRIGRWIVVRHLGSGGTAAVYEAKHGDLEKPVALKVLHRRHAFDRAMRVRFLREGRVMAALRHPNVVEVHDVGVEDDRVFLVMELLDGEPLAALLAREGPLPPARIARVMGAVLEALAEVHARAVVHRDVKPANIFLARGRDGAERPVLLDFGVARTEDRHDVTRSGVLLGTPAYMSPEQARGERNVGPRSDVFSAGAVLYECATGQRPFPGGTWQSVLLALARADLRPPRALRPDLPRAFEEVVLKALAARPEDRYESATALGAALARSVAPSAVPVIESGDGSPATRRRRALPWALAATGGAVLMLVAGVAPRHAPPSIPPVAPAPALALAPATALASTSGAAPVQADAGGAPLAAKRATAAPTRPRPRRRAPPALDRGTNNALILPPSRNR